MPQGEGRDVSSSSVSTTAARSISTSSICSTSQGPSRLSITVPDNQLFLPQYLGEESEGGREGSTSHSSSESQGGESEGREREDWVDEDDEGVRGIELGGEEENENSRNFTAPIFDLPPRTPISLPTISYGEVDNRSNQRLHLRRGSGGTSSDGRQSLSSFADSESRGVRSGPTRLSEDVRAMEDGEEERSEEARSWKEEQRCLAERTLDRRNETAAAPNADCYTPDNVSDTRIGLPPDTSFAAPSSPMDSTTSNSSQPFISVANGPLAQLSTAQLLEPRQVPRGARSFLSSLLNRSPRSSGSSPRFPSQQSPSPSPTTSPNPDATTPRALQTFDRFPSASDAQLRRHSSLLENQHIRSSSLPPILPPSPNASRARQSMEVPRRSSPRPDTSPRLSRTIASIGRSVSMRNSPSDKGHKLNSPPLSKQSPQQSGSHPSPPTLDSIGLSVVTLSPPLSTNRAAPPLCGAILDDKYLLIGTAFGLDFMPLPLPGSLPFPQLGNKKRKSTRRPMSLIKRTKFKALAILNERSNILLAIAGRNDHIRVYPLDGIRALIERKMNEIDIRDGYPFIQDAIILQQPSKSTLKGCKGKGKAVAIHASSGSRTAPSASDNSLPVDHYRFPLDRSPPAYTLNSTHSDRRRPSSAYFETSSARPVSPTSRSFSRNNSLASLSNGAIVRAVPAVPRGSVSSATTITPSTSRTLRNSSSMDHIAHRRGSVATISRRRSRIDLNVARSSALHSTRSRTSQSEQGLSLESLLRSEATSDTSTQSSSTNEGDTDRPSISQFLPASSPTATGTPAPSATDSSALNSVPSQPISRLVARSPFALSPAMSNQDSSLMSLIEAVTDGPPPSANAGLGISSDNVMDSEGRKLGSRIRKRWTVSGVGSSLNAIGNEGISDPPSLNNSTSQARNSSVAHRHSRANDAFSQSTTEDSSRRDRRESGDFKHRSRQSSLQPNTYPSIPTSSQERQESNVKSSSTLEYVKLARTRGARLMRATETKKRTYLAVLCGGEGERIELFTGARSISLSLNRTFVLPETPRSIDLQLQGNDLVDIYLIYAQTIFALEPSTVRVREVGVGRRSHRSRRATDVDQDTTEPTTLVDALQSSEALPPTSSTPPSTDARHDVETSTDQVHVDRTTSPPLPPPSVSTSATAHPPQSETTTPISPTPDSPFITPSSSGSIRKKPSSPYSTFSQLPFIPPVPSGVLSSSWTIPPLYTDVIATKSISSNDTTEDGLLAKPDVGNSNLPLLSPVSLLRGAAMRGAAGPPGLFLVTKGDSLSGIVTSEGKSVIKRPISWTLATDSISEEIEDLPQDVQILTVGGDKTVVVKFSPSDVRAVAVEGNSTSPSKLFSPPVLASPPITTSGVQFLANHHQSHQLFYSQSIGQSWTIQCLASR